MRVMKSGRHDPQAIDYQGFMIADLKSSKGSLVKR
jgi:hypothetical protein